MFSASAAFYDLIYGGFKDYPAEAARVAEVIVQAHPEARTVLDVACGTGEHARLLAEDFGYEVDGFDVEPAFVRIARQKSPASTFWQADMTTFDLRRRYDIVLCLFSSIGYVRTLEGLAQALSNFERHLTDGGLVIVEPWLTPDAWQPGSVHLKTAEVEGLKVCRMSHAEVEERVSILTFEYLIGTAEGIRRTREVHEMGLFTVGEMLQSFEAAGLSARHDEEGLTGRGLYVARRAV